MENKFSRKVILLMVISFVFALALSAQTRQVDLSPSASQALLHNNSDLGFDVHYTVGELQIREVQTKAGMFDELFIEGWTHTGEVGEPKLPLLRKIIAVPLGADVRLTVNSRTTRELDTTVSQLKHRLLPAQAPVSKSADPATLPFVVNEASYQRSGYNDRDCVRVEDLGMMRGLRIFALDFLPVRYDPAGSLIEVLEDVSVRVDYLNPDLLATADLLSRTGSYEFDRLYDKSIFNWTSGERTSIVRYPTKMLILCPPAYTTTLQPYVDWKTQQGYAVTVTTVGTGGTIANTTTAIKNYMTSVWSAATSENPAPTYLLIVGDTSTSGNNVIAMPAQVTSPSSDHVTDNYYVRLSGTDYVPEMYYGRFSVSSATELTNIVNKTMTWEKTQMTDLSYLGNVVMIAGQDATFGPTHADGAIKYGTQNYFNAAHGITSNTYLYAVSGSSDATIIANANSGRGYINYTAHGDVDRWYDPTFTVTNVNAMTNTGKYGVMVGNCCLTNAFDTGVCFGESIIRKANAAGVAYIGGTNSTYWDEDYWWAVGAKGTANGNAPAYNATKLGVYDVMFHDHNEAFTDWATTTGETIWMGNLAVNQGGSSYINYYWEIYSVMGDPSLMPYFGVPTTNPASYPSQIQVGATSYAITGAAPYTRIGLSMNGVIYGTGITDASGNLTLTITPFSTAGTATLVLTAQDRITVIDSIPVQAASGPYMEVTSANYDDANNDVPEYNESGYFDVTFKNSGTSTATNVTATLSCSTTGITITDGSHTISSLAAGSSTTADNAYAISIANNVANGTVANFTITMTSGSNNWSFDFSKTVNAPALAFGSMTISDTIGDNDGLLDPGETVTVAIPLNNTGAAASLAGTGTLSCATSGITVVNGSASFTAISAGGYATLSFSVSAASSMSEGTLAAFVFNAFAGQYSATTTVNVEVGAPLVVIIGNGSSSQSYPIDRYYNYSSHEAIYLASEIGTAGTIKSLGFQKASGTDVNTIEAVTVYMKNTTTATLATGNYSTTGYTQVYSGTWPNTATSGWMEVDLQNQFAYDGTNLSILTIKGNQAYITNYPYWTYTTASATRARQNRSDTEQPASLTASTNLPNLKLKLYPAVGLLYPPQNLAATATHGSVTLTWQAPVSGTPTGYKVYKNNNALTTVTALSYTDTAVTDGTTYSYKVSALYGSDESDATATVTATPNMYAPTNLTATGGNSVVMLSWTAAAGREAEGSAGRGTKEDRAISSYKIYRDGAALTTVSGTSYNDTNVTNGTTYSYHVTTLYTNPAGESAPSNTAVATPNAVSEVIIGTGTSSNGTSEACPINVYYESLHGQAVYTKAELNAAGVTGPINITQLGFNVTGLPTLAMPGYVIRMGHTSATNVASWISTGLTQVWNSASYQPTSTGWNMLTLSTPFTWNGTDNLLIDTAFGDIGSWNSSGTTQYTSVTSGYRYARNDDADQTNVFTGGSTSASRPNVKLALAPQVTGPAIAVNPTSVSATADEGASTTVTVTVNNSGTSALNWSTASSFAAWGTVSPASGTILAGGNTVLTLTLNAVSLTAGNYTANMVIASNAVNHPSLTVPVSFTVEAYVEPSDIRFIAEWEPATGTIIAYSGGFGLPYTMIADLSTRGEVYVLVTSSTQSTASSLLSSNGVTMSNVSFIVRDGINTYWTRDYGPWSIFDANGEMGIVDFKYNRNRPYDDAVNAVLDDYFGFGYQYMPLVATGGNVMTDGQGKMMSSNLILSENDGVQTAQVTEYDYTQSEIEDLVQQYLGVEDYYFFADPLSNSSIDHIDCHAKLLDVDKVMIARVPVGHANYAALEATVAAWQAKTSSYGTPYQIYRVNQTSSNEPYSNAFIFNNKIYVPQWNATASAADLAAVAAYQAAMPGYTVQGYYSSSWLSDDAIHCRVQSIYDEQMLHLAHVPPTSATANSYVVLNVTITHSNPLNTSATYIAYRHSTTGQWLTVPLTLVSGDTWTASVPTPALGQTLYYYILATDNTARTALMPLCGASDPFELLVDIPGSNTAPTIALPASFTFAEDGSLGVDFSQYVDDEDGDTLTLSYSGADQVSVSINGLSVTFTAAANWYGTDNLSFTVSDGTDTASDNVNVIVTPVTDPAVMVVAPLSLAYGEVEVGSTSVKTFTITNNGEATLSGNITTPTGYSVAEAARTRGEGDREAAGKAARNTLSYSVASGVTKTYNLTFAPTAAIAYNGNVTVTGNDPVNPSDTIVITGMGHITNTAPTIVLPDSFGFDENGSLVVDFSQYVDDAEDDELTLSYSGNTNVFAAIAGLTVTFTATADWDGTENLTFTVSDGNLNASDTVEVIVNNVNVPPTIALPEVFEFDMNGTLVVDFSQYVNDADGGTLTLGYSGNSNVNVSIDGLTVTFTATADWYGTENLTFTVSDGTDAASDTAVVIVHLTSLAVPGISISYVDAASDYVKVEWNAIPNANFYQVWGCNDPFGTYSFLGETTDAYWNDMDLGQMMRFYRIIASDESYLITK